MAFNGFADSAFEFFMAIAFNNNKEFFESNWEWYMSSIKRPMYELCVELAPSIQALDNRIETRPVKCLSRIRRDTRFTRDKSPYRDHAWLQFRRPGTDSSQIGAWFELDSDGASYGIGIYGANKVLMDALRYEIRENPKKVEAVLKTLPDKFAIYGERYVRIKMPEGLNSLLSTWYPLKGFYVECEIRDMELLKSAELIEVLKKDYASLAKLYSFMANLPAQAYENQ